MTWRRAAIVALGVLCLGCRAHPWAELGQVNHRYFVESPVLDDPDFGKSSGAPVALRIPVAAAASGNLSYVGRLVHDELFPSYPAFDFTVAFASARVDFWGHSAYADPESIWYNVFFGFYEIDAPTDVWTRPFGYASAAADAAPVVDDVALIGRADWNFFSNHLYGVPLEAIHRCCAHPPRPDIQIRARVTVPSHDARRQWDELEVRGMTVVGPHRSMVDHGAFEPPRSPAGGAPPEIERLWQRAFGTHEPVSPPASSFGPVRLHARIRMFHDKARVRGHEVYRTFLFGGTVSEDFPDVARAGRFLDAQVAALEKVMKGTGLGFGD